MKLPSLTMRPAPALLCLALGALAGYALAHALTVWAIGTEALAPGGRGGRESGLCIDGTWVPTEEATYG